tara:strand:+ start:1037 stop:1180 length:144 start_codon:yes stop_codon:yes gene_type:complete
MNDGLLIALICCHGGGFLLIIKGKGNKSFKEFYKCEIKTFKKLIGIK